MEDKYEKLMEKFHRIMESGPDENEAVEFWSKISAKEYDDLIDLFSKNKVDGMSDEIRMKLVDLLKNLRQGLHKNE